MEDKEIEQLAEQYLLPLRQYCQDGQSEALCYNGFVDGFKKSQELLGHTEQISIDDINSLIKYFGSNDRTAFEQRMFWRFTRLKADTPQPQLKDK